MRGNVWDRSLALYFLCNVVENKTNLESIVQLESLNIEGPYEWVPCHPSACTLQRSVICCKALSEILKYRTEELLILCIT